MYSLNRIEHILKSKYIPHRWNDIKDEDIQLALHKKKDELKGLEGQGILDRPKGNDSNNGLILYKKGVVSFWLDIVKRKWRKGKFIGQWGHY